MNRREFLKGTMGFVLACAAGGVLGKGVINPGVASEDDIGPRLVEGLRLEPCAEGAEVYVGEACAFKVNAGGAKLLKYADGRHRISEIAAAAGYGEAAQDVAMFYVTLGESGYLQGKFEVNIIENEG